MSAYEPRFGDAIAPWRQWFAWRPVQTVDRGWQWLRFVQRRRIQLKPYLDNSAFSFWFQFAVDVPGVSTNTRVEGKNE